MEMTGPGGPRDVGCWVLGMEGVCRCVSTHAMFRVWTTKERTAGAGRGGGACPPWWRSMQDSRYCSRVARWNSSGNT